MFLKETLEIAPALALIYQASVHQKSIPDTWREAYISSIYKAGKRGWEKLRITGLFQ